MRVSVGAGSNTTLAACRPGGDRGALQSAPRSPGCRGPRDSYIKVSRGGTRVNFDGTLEEAFACIAALGEGGCPFQQPLQSAGMALGFGGQTPAENQGFFRPNAHLALYFLSEEDDCSAPADTMLFDPESRTNADRWGPLSSYCCNEFGHLCDGKRPPRATAGELFNCHSAEDGVLTPVATMVSFVNALKSQPGMVLVSAMAGPQHPYVVRLEPTTMGGGVTEDIAAITASCSAQDGTSSRPGVRMKDFTDSFREQGVFLPLCAGTFEPALMRVAEDISHVPRCLNADVLDSASTNLASDCVVFQELVTDSESRIQNLIPACDSTAATPCWDVHNRPGCPMLVIDGQVGPPRGGAVTVQCGGPAR